jgi:hypothetical protein
MSYVKISDPNIIDIAAWQQVINVVNEHSDSITAITNNFNGIGSASVDWTAATWSHVWDPGSQAIVYGKIKADTSTLTLESGVYWGTGNFSDENISSVFTFGSIPIVTATLYSGHPSSGNVSSTNKQAVVSIYDITTAGFKWRISSLSSTPISGILYIMWTAIGPRS